MARWTSAAAIGITNTYGGLGSASVGTWPTWNTSMMITGLLAALPLPHSASVVISGSASELVFNFQGSARLDSLAITISGLSFGNSAYDFKGFNLSGDDPMLWFNTSSGIFSITEQEIASPPASFGRHHAGAENGYVDFAYFTSKMGFDTNVSSFALRETRGDVWVKDIYVGDFTTAPVPEPGSALLMRQQCSLDAAPPPSQKPLPHFHLDWLLGEQCGRGGDLFWPASAAICSSFLFFKISIRFSLGSLLLLALHGVRLLRQLPLFFSPFPGATPALFL
jgi:hypothetical protein